MPKTLFTVDTTDGDSPTYRWEGGGGLIAIYGTMGGATVSLQWSPDDGITWFELDSFTATGQANFNVPGGVPVKAVISSAGGGTIISAKLFETDEATGGDSSVGGGGDATAANQVLTNAILGTLTDLKELDPDAASATLAGILRGMLDGVYLKDPATGDRVQYTDVIETNEVVPTITMDTAAYADGDTMGGKITITDFARRVGGSGNISRLQLRTKLTLASTIFVHIFRENPSASTFTDNAAMVLNSADEAKLIDTITVLAADWGAAEGVNPWRTFECIDPGLGRRMYPYKCAALSRDIYLAFEADGAVDFVAATDFGVIIAAENN